jgi:hypothetical protein
LASARLSSVSECPPPAPVVERPTATLRMRLVEKGVVIEVHEVEKVRWESKAVWKALRGGRGGEVAVEGRVDVEAFREAVEMMLQDEDEDDAASVRRLARGGVARAVSVLGVSALILLPCALHISSS